MADVAYQRQYRAEFIAAFEDRSSMLQGAVTTESQIKGNECIFLLADSGNATAVTRGLNGLIPARADNLTQVTCTLQEWHDKVIRTRWNLFASQGDGKRIMQETTMAVINRKRDDLVIAELDTATNDTGPAQIASIDLVMYARTILGNNFIDLSDENNLFGVISPAFDAYLMQAPEYASANYVDVKVFGQPLRKYRRWAGFNWIVHSRLTGSVGAGGTGASEQCYLFHRNAIGSAVDKDGLESVVGYDEQDAYTFARVSFFSGAKLLQNAGVVQMLHQASAYVAQ